MSLVTVADLDAEHRSVFAQAISTVLNTDLAELTFAQIIDGVPLPSVFTDNQYGGLDIDHPLHRHTELCPGVLEKAREYRDAFNPDELSFSSRVPNS